MKPIVLTDHAALAPLFKGTNVSGRLARWALVVQEFQPTILYRPGSHNTGPDALSRVSLPRGRAGGCEGEQIDDCVEENSLSLAVQPYVCVLTRRQAEQEGTSGDRSESQQEGVGGRPSQDRGLVETNEEPEHLLEGTSLAEEQRLDTHLAEIIDYIESGRLPADEKRARRIVLERERFDIVDGVLTYCDGMPPYCLRIAVPKQLQPVLLAEAHGSRFGGHSAEKSLFGKLRQRYWWDGTRAAVRKKCRRCVPCATRMGPGVKTRPPLQPILVGGPFHRVAVDVLTLPHTTRGNRYVIVFVDY